MESIYTITNPKKRPRINISGRYVSLILMMMLLVQTSFAQIFVKQGATGSGTSWNNATGTVPTGTLAANTKIYIAAGNYSIGTLTVLRENGILIQGGFPATAQGTDISGYNPLQNVTTLTRTGTGNNRGFYQGSSRSQDVTKIMEVKGIQFTGAHDNGSLFYLTSGYGVYRFTDVTGYNMTSTNGVIYLTTFNGGSVTVENSNFYGNTATADGGVIYHSTDNNNAKLIIKGSSFTNNKADHGGALYITSIQDAADAVLIENSSFCSNQSNLYGGAIYQTTSRIKITGSTFSNNICPSGYYGGAIFCTTSQLTIDGSSFYGNEGGAGGAIYSTTWFSSNVNTLNNSVFYGNKATDDGSAAGTNGGGAMAINANANAWTIQNTKFVANEVLAPSWGGAISHYDAETSLDNCLFFDNKKGGNAGISGSDIKNYDNAGGFFTIANSKMQLAATSSYTNQAGGTDASSYGFTTGNTFSNTDNGGVTNPGFTCPITISFKDPFVTLPDFNVTYVNVPVTGNVSTNDTYPVGTTYGTPVPDGTNPTGGTITLNPDGTYTFTGTTTGVYVYQVPVCIPSGGTPCPTETLTITVLDKDALNPPVANPDYASGKGSATGSAPPITSIVKANDGPGNVGGVLGNPTITSTNPPTNVGTIDVVDGNVVFTPAAGFYGEYEATYNICETPGGLCASTTATFLVSAPGTSNTTAAADDYVSTPQGVTVTGNVKTNDTDPEGDEQTVTPQTGVVVTSKGTLDLLADGSFTFVPEAGFTGPVEFVYQTCDDGTPSACQSATLHILVVAVPDLTPRIAVTPSIVHGNTTLEVVLSILEVGKSTNTKGEVIVRVRRNAILVNDTFAYDPLKSISAGGLPVQNSIWTVDLTNPTYYIFKTTTIIPKNSQRRLAYSIQIQPGGSDGVLSILTSIPSGNVGGEINVLNNNDDEEVRFYNN
jgi:predicted outer membrane repeat protein